MKAGIDRRGFLATGGVAAMLAGCGASVEEEEAPAGSRDRLVRMLDAEVRTFDPHVLTDLSSAQVARDQFQGLTRFDAKGEVVPSLSSGWDVSEDGLDWRFTVLPGLTFSDGHPITAATFVKTYDRLYDDALGSPHRSFADLMESMTAKGDVVHVRLKAPYPALAALLAHPAFSALPHHRIEAMGNDWTGDRPIVASGPYRAKLWILNNRIELERNPEWHGPPAPIANVLWRPADDALSAMRSFLAGEVDITGFPAIRTDWLREELDDPNGKVVTTEPYLGIYYYVFNMRRPPFDDARIRKALTMTVERQWLVEKVIRNDAPPAFAYVPPELSASSRWLPDWRDAAREARLAAARKLLAEAGYGPGRPLRFQLRFNSSPDHRRIAAGAAAMWRSLGVEVELFNSEAALHFDAMQRGDFQVARSGWVADLPAPENFLENLLGSAGPRNYSGYDNPRYDAAFGRALQISDPRARAIAMGQAEAIMLRDWPVLPIYYYNSRALVAPKIGGWHANAMNSHPNYDLYFKYGADRGAAS